MSNVLQQLEIAKQEIIVLIDGIEKGIFLAFFDWKTFDIVTELEYQNSKEFVEDIPKLFEPINVKAVIIWLFFYKSKEYSSNYEFRSAVRDVLDELSVPYFFQLVYDFYFNSLIIAANFDIKIGDSIITVSLHNDKLIVFGLKFLQTGFQRFKDDEMLKFQKLKLEELFKLLSKDGRKVIVRWHEGAEDQAVLFNGAENIKVFKCGTNEFFTNTLKEVSRWIVDDSQTKFHLIPYLVMDFRISLLCNGIRYPIHEINRAFDEYVPLHRDFFGKTSKFEYLLEYDGKVVQLNLSQFKQYKISLEIDKNNFFSFQILPSETYSAVPDIYKILPKIMNHHHQSNVKKNPVIVLQNNTYLILYYVNDEVGYKYNALDGRLANHLYISFDKEVEEYGYDAKKALKTHPENVVWDLIFLMSQPPENFFVKDCYKFKIKKNDEHSVNLEFRVHDGTWNSATPSFLFAMFIKRMRLAIKEELKTKSRPTELCFCLIEVENEELIKNGIEESCALLNQYITIEEKRIQCNFLDLK